MKWYNYLACFFAGMFIGNFVPHFVNGISGNAFPTPFANPPGQGLSSPTINIAWSLANLLVGYLLLRVSKLNSSNKVAMIIFFLGIAAISFMLADAFALKAKI